FVSSGASSPKGVGGRYIFVPIVVDNRKEILREILNTPQERPPMRPVASQAQVDGERLEVEAQAHTHRVTTLDDLYEEFEFGISPQGVDPKSRREKLPSRIDEQNDDCVPYANYGYIDTEGRRSGIAKRFCSPADLQGGSAASNAMIDGFPNPGHHPKVGRKYSYNRGHLLGAQLGGDGTDQRNLVTMYRATNDPQMKKYENMVARSVRSNESIVYHVRPVYRGNAKIPDLIHMVAVGDRGTSFDVCITNESVPIKQENVPCV
ncbi:DNA/RNA non-specific endonuclease, partial [Nocardiopsis prasina]|uniref:DNA/RNA non-specific endonuclease n=1 Tax=Nocardiopsis prasina TaxID=2015 RepID=UPI001872C65D